MEDEKQRSSGLTTSVICMSESRKKRKLSQLRGWVPEKGQPIITRWVGRGQEKRERKIGELQTEQEIEGKERTLRGRWHWLSWRFTLTHSAVFSMWKWVRCIIWEARSVDYLIVAVTRTPKTGWEPSSSLWLSFFSSFLPHKPSGGVLSGQTLNSPQTILQLFLPPSPRHCSQHLALLTQQGQQGGWETKTGWWRKLCRTVLRQSGLCSPWHQTLEVQSLARALRNLGWKLQRRIQVEATNPAPSTNH